jgi:ATP-dependent RNA helicase DDX55/SPB4
MPELKNMNQVEYIGRLVNVNDIMFLDKGREKKRLETLATLKEQRLSKKKKILSTPWSHQTEAKQKKLDRKEKKLKKKEAILKAKLNEKDVPVGGGNGESLGKKRKLVDMDEWNELASEIRKMKNEKKGKVVESDDEVESTSCMN